MDEKTLIEITKSTITEVDRLLRLNNSDYVKEFGCESERTDKAKIERTVNMVSTLNFFIDQYYLSHGSGAKVLNESASKEKVATRK